VALKAVLSVQQRKEPLSPNSAGKVDKQEGHLQL